MQVYLDFDGTVVEHHYPLIGRRVPHAIRVVEALKKKGHKIILNSVRCDMKDKTLDAAKRYFQYNLDSTLDCLLDACVDKKIYAPRWDLDYAIKHDILFIDDQATNMPLIRAVMINNWMVDWLEVEKQLIAKGIL